MSQLKDRERLLPMEALERLEPFMSAHCRFLIDDHPRTRLQAMMEAAPGDTEMESVEELMELRDVLNDALEAELDETERWMLDLLVTERRPLSHVAKMMGGTSKSTVGRRRDALLGRLRERLQNEPVIAARLHTQTEDE